MLARLRAGIALAAVALAATTAACAPPGDDEESSALAISESEASAVLEIGALDLWAQPLVAPSLTVTRGGRAVRPPIRSGTARVLLGPVGSYVVDLAAPDHTPLRLTLDWDGAKVTTRDATLAPDGGRAGVTVARGETSLSGRAVPAHRVFLGLRHAWFSAQARAPRPGNAVELLMNGEAAWRSVATRLREAKRSVLVSTWWWDSDFELVRDTPMASTRERKKNTILSLLDASPAEKRVLVGQLLGTVSLLDWMTSDAALRSRVNDPRLQFMREGNDTRGTFRFDVTPVRFGDRVVASGAAEASRLEPEAPIPSTVPGHDVDLTTLLPGFDLASVHQKFFVVDSETAYVAGMNMRVTDWDTSGHEVADVRRLPFDATKDQREAAATKTCLAGPDGSPPLTCAPPDPGPRKDYMLRVDGPAVADVEDVFVGRWNALVARRVADAEGRTPMPPVDRAASAEPKGDVTVQITTTAPGKEHGIAETWFNAIRNASSFVYIEDQYFRMPMLHEALARRMEEKPDLRLVVITRPVSRLDPGCAPTRDAARFFRERWPDRFLYLTTKAFDPTYGRYDGFVEVFLHAKMLVVDDVFMSVGSANKNNRGLVYELEMNAAVLDRPFVSASRKRMLRALVPDLVDSDDVATWFAELRAVAEDNQRVFDQNQDVERPVQRPRGLPYPLRTPSSCAFAGVGPDAT